MEAIQIFVFALVAIVISYVQERTGGYDKLAPWVKQVVNGVLSAVIPVAVGWSAGWWQPSFGDATEVWTQVAYLVVPVFVWLITQVAHQFDRILQKAGDK